MKRNFCYLVLRFNSATERTEANLPSGIFQSVRDFVQRLSDDSFIMSEISSLLIGRTIFFRDSIFSFVLLIGYM